VSNALFVQGNSYFRAGDMDQAISTYQQIIEDYPQMGWAKNAQFQIGICFNKLSGGGGIEYLPKLSEAFQTYYNRYPDDEQAVYAYYYDAWARYRMGRWREASETFEALVNRYPNSEYAPESLYRAGEAVFNLAGGMGYEEKLVIYKEATAKYASVLSKYPRSDYVDDALYNTAWGLINLDRKEEALPIFEQIVAEHSDGRYGARSQFTLGDYYYGQKVYDKATESYEKFLAMFPDDKLESGDKGLRRKATVLLGHLSEIDAYNMYAVGERFFDGKEFEEAIEIFKNVQNKYPDSDQTVNAAVNIGAAYMALEDYRKAAAEFQRVVDTYEGEDRFSPQVDFARQQLEVMAEARVI
jgi:TolA-binding protein